MFKKFISWFKGILGLVVKVVAVYAAVFVFLTVVFGIAVGLSTVLSAPVGYEQYVGKMVFRAWFDGVPLFLKPL